MALGMLTSFTHSLYQEGCGIECACKQGFAARRVSLGVVLQPRPCPATGIHPHCSVISALLGEFDYGKTSEKWTGHEQQVSAKWDTEK